MPKDDPLQQTETLWLDRDAMEIARERYFKAWDAMNDTPDHALGPAFMRRALWDLSWATAVAVHSFISEGRLGPPSEEDSNGE